MTLADRILDELEGRGASANSVGFRVAHVAGAGTEALRGVPVLASTLAAGAVRERPAGELTPRLEEALGDRLVLTLPLISRGRMIGAIGGDRRRSTARSTGAC